MRETRHVAATSRLGSGQLRRASVIRGHGRDGSQSQTCGPVRREYGMDDVEAPVNVAFVRTPMSPTLDTWLATSQHCASEARRPDSRPAAEVDG